ncbi:MAG: hypothetical protein PVI00_00995 [Desulfobacterales bacterium]|jgi:hypothetical protein
MAKTAKPHHVEKQGVSKMTNLPIDQDTDRFSPGTVRSNHKMDDARFRV